MTHSPSELFPRAIVPLNSELLDRAGRTIDALVPLSLLEAVRALDLPDAELDLEMVHEMRNKRFGLSETVHMQIKRYGDAARRGQRSSYSEVEALARLVGRRPDADLVFLESGRRVARASLATVGASARRLTRTLPRAVGRPLALRRLRALALRYLGGTVKRQGSTLILEVPSAVTADAAPNGSGCGFYEAALRELLLGLTDIDHVVQSVACRARGDSTCQWRTDWRR